MRKVLVPYFIPMDAAVRHGVELVVESVWSGNLGKVGPCGQNSVEHVQGVVRAVVAVQLVIL